MDQEFTEGTMAFHAHPDGETHDHTGKDHPYIFAEHNSDDAVLTIAVGGGPLDLDDAILLLEATLYAAYAVRVQMADDAERIARIARLN